MLSPQGRQGAPTFLPVEQATVTLFENNHGYGHFTCTQVRDCLENEYRQVGQGARSSARQLACSRFWSFINHMGLFERSLPGSEFVYFTYRAYSILRSMLPIEVQERRQ